jgi:hypothetical protein
MSTLRQNQLKQLNALDRAISNISKAITIGEKQEELGFNNGALAVKLVDLLDIYQKQLAIGQEDDRIDVDIKDAWAQV